MSDLKSTLSGLEETLGRLVTALKAETDNSAELATITNRYEQLCESLNTCLEGVTELPTELLPAQERVTRLHSLVKQVMAEELETTTNRIVKVRASRKALGGGMRMDSVALGATGIDCNIQG